MNFRVEIPTYRGPLDLLLYLVRKHELDIVDIPIAKVTRQYLEYLEILQALDVNGVADFLELASTLIEIKSKLVLPTQEEADEQVLDDPRDQLVTRLLEYKRFKDAASLLEDRGRAWQQRFRRMVDDLPPRKIDPAEQPIDEVELWDLVSALNRLLRDNRSVQPTNIVYDDTPIEVYMSDIHQRLATHGEVRFLSLFEKSTEKTKIVGIFLALLELIRNFGVAAQQNDGDQEIWLTPGQNFQKDAAFEKVKDYDHGVT